MQNLPDNKLINIGSAIECATKEYMMYDRHACRIEQLLCELEKFKSVLKNQAEQNDEDKDSYIRVRIIMQMDVYCQTTRFICAHIQNSNYGNSLIPNARSLFEIYLRWLYIFHLSDEEKFCILARTQMDFFVQNDFELKYREWQEFFKDVIPGILNWEEVEGGNRGRIGEFLPCSMVNYNCIIKNDIDGMNLNELISCYHERRNSSYDPSERERIYSMTSELSHGNESLSHTHKNTRMWIFYFIQESLLCLFELLGRTYPELGIEDSDIKSFQEQYLETMTPIIEFVNAGK